MKSISMNAYANDDTQPIRVSVDLLVPAARSIHEALAIVSGQLTNGRLQAYHPPLDAGTQDDWNEPSASAPAVDTSPQAEAGASAPAVQEVGRRRRRTAAEMAEAANPTKEPTNEHGGPVDQPGTIGPEPPRRRRAVAEQPSPDPMPINDAEMSKAASNAAEFYVNLGEDGPATVMLILNEDFGVKSATDIAQDKRQAFIDALQKEMKLAQAEHDAKAAA